MKVIQPNCRIQFTAEDVSFIQKTLGKEPGDQGFLADLLTDPISRDVILDDAKLLKALLEDGGCLRVSNHFYFYVVVRAVLRPAGIEDRVVADYVAELLTEFSETERSRCVIQGRDRPLEYFFEMLAALQSADDRTRFCIRAYIGNYSLFLSGIFSERIRHRAEQRGFPGISYFRDLGQINFRIAGDHRLAERYELAGVFDTLSSQFERTRRALHDLSERVFSLGDPPLPILQRL
ncbi:MAG: hypothetical protein H7X97_10145 [Opitutaceae bacterium]|nr:hypothetical protein [Verrucomicrobiales bacterium]